MTATSLHNSYCTYSYYYYYSFTLYSHRMITTLTLMPFSHKVITTPTYLQKVLDIETTLTKGSDSFQHYIQEETHPGQTNNRQARKCIRDKRRQHTQHITDRQRCCRSGSRRSSYKCYNAEVTMVQEGVVTVQHAVTTVTDVCATYQEKRMQP